GDAPSMLPPRARWNRDPARRMDKGRVHPARIHLAKRILRGVVGDLAVVGETRRLVVLPQMDLRVDDQHGAPLRRRAIAAAPRWRGERKNAHAPRRSADARSPSPRERPAARTPRTGHATSRQRWETDRLARRESNKKSPFRLA